MRCSDPLWLLLLAAVPLLIWGAAVWRRRAAERMARLSRHAKGVPPRSTPQLWLLLGAFVFGVVALAGPRWGRGAEEVAARGRGVMLAVDVSRSMLAQDVRPDRLGRAKADLIDLVDSLRGDRAGLLAFRGKGALLCPMTSDAAFLRQSIDALAPDSAPPGETDLADAIAKCLEALGQDAEEHGAIVLISDGEDLAGRAEAMAKEAGRRGIPIFTVGIGSAQGATIPDGASVLTHDGQPVRSRLTESTLRAIADASGGRYVPLATAGTAQTTLGAVYSRYLTRLADQEARERVETAFADRTGIFAFLAALCALAAAGLSLGRVSAARAALPALLTLPLGVWAQEPARAAQRDYRAGRYAEAAEGYARARVGAEASEAAHYAYNEALALWKAGQPTNALERVRLAVGDRAFTAQASTLEGTLLMRQAEGETDPARRLALREEATAAFARALQADPTEAARRNLARATDGLPELRRAARRAAALKQYEGQHLGQLAPALLRSQRALAKAVPEVFGGADPAVRLSQAEQLAKDVRTQADRWFPVLEALPQAVTNETLRAELLTRSQAAQNALDAAAEGYGTLSLRAADPLVEGEPFVYDLWKTLADPPALNAESIAVQTNALTSVTRYQPARDDEEEVLALTQQFRLLFPQWAEEQLRQQAASTNAVTFTEADRDLIARTADATVPLLAPPVSPENRRKVMENLLLIREHLPKNEQNNQNQQQPSPQQQNQQQQQQQQNQQQNKDDSQQPQPSEQEGRQEPSPEEQDLQALLQKAADRNREHEEAKRRAARARMQPGARDW